MVKKIISRGELSSTNPQLFRDAIKYLPLISVEWFDLTLTAFYHSGEIDQEAEKVYLKKCRERGIIPYSSFHLIERENHFIPRPFESWELETGLDERKQQELGDQQIQGKKPYSIVLHSNPDNPCSTIRPKRINITRRALENFWYQRYPIYWNSGYELEEGIISFTESTELYLETKKTENNIVKKILTFKTQKGYSEEFNRWFEELKKMHKNAQSRER